MLDAVMVHPKDRDRNVGFVDEFDIRLSVIRQGDVKRTKRWKDDLAGIC